MIKPIVAHPDIRRWLAQGARRIRQSRRRSILEFATEEIRIPKGKYKGRRYDPMRKPASKLWFDAIDSGLWQRFNYTGPIQSGKTLDAFLIPIAYCLFEKGEDVIVGLPDMNLAMSKWQKDIQPIIESSRYAHLIPRRGSGSRGGKFREIKFANGTWIIFMSFGGGDKSRSSETAPNLIITETDGANDVSETSDEGTAIQQLIGRTMSYDLDAFVCQECTVSHVDGITWQTHLNGTQSRIARPCGSCAEYVTPEREHFIGWESAPDILQAGELARWCCPACGVAWTDSERFEANKKSVLIHKGQEINKKGVVSGPRPPVDTLSFRVGAIDNFFRSSEMLGRECWQAMKARDQLAAQRTIKQQQFTEPDAPDDTDELPPLELEMCAARVHRGNHATKENEIPVGHEIVTVGTDLRATQAHFVATSWAPDGTPRIVANDVVKVYTQKYGPKVALMMALRFIRDEILKPGFMPKDGGERMYPDQWFIDANWQTDLVYDFVNECNFDEFWDGHVQPFIGRGYGKKYKGNYTHPEKEGGFVKAIIEQAHKRYNKKQRAAYWLVNADHWKIEVHNALRIPMFVPDDEGNPTDELNPGALTIYTPTSGDHMDFMRELLAEEQRTIFTEKGEVQTMIQKFARNHFLDATYASFVAANYCGIRTIRPAIHQQPISVSTESEKPDSAMLMPDGRPFEY